MTDQELEAIEEEVQDIEEGLEQAAESEEPDEEPEPEPEQEDDGLNLTPEQEKAILDKAIEEGKVVDYEGRFKPIYGALKQAERDLAEAKKGKEPETEEKPPSFLGKPKPNPDDFDDYEKYNEALVSWMFDEREARQARTERQKSWNEQIQEAGAKNPDFFEKAYIPNDMVPLLDGTDKLAEFGLYFGQHPEEARAIIAMSPMQAARKLGQIEASFSMPEQRTRTKAPNSPPPDKGKVTIKKDPEKMDYNEYKEWRLGQEA